VSRARIPLSTYRLQFNSDFTFRDARAIVGYLHALGIGDCYASSYLMAVPDSPHGYDVADPTRLNPDIGTDEDYWAWIDALRARDMGHLLDLVPNHMGIAKAANPWWFDVLENGPSSRFATFFDIAWRPVKDELADKVLIPVLGDQYGAVLERQELRLAYDRGTFVVHYHDERLPIAPDTLSTIVASHLDGWLGRHAGQSASDADELQSILTASRNLPGRSTRDPHEIATRAREKEVIKRRLASLFERSAEVRTLIDDSVRHINGVADNPRSFDALDRLLNEQSYRLAHWRVASEEINYRRFFDVNQLAALRMEDPAVFDEVHRFALELVQRGAATGLRVDHVDGLYAPGDYLRRLQARSTHASEDPDDHPFFIVVEKILGDGEELPRDWPIHGTTGYEFAAIVNGLFVDRRNERTFDDIYHRFVRERLSFADLAYRSKKQILHETMSGDINSIGHRLNRFSEGNRHFRDFTLYSLISTLKEIIACFPVYRTYVTEREPVAPRDRRYISEAVEGARRRSPGVTGVVFDFVERLLLKETVVTTHEECEARATLVGKFQQLTSPVAAKGIEDTALYLYNRLLSLNEVGFDPTRFGMDPSDVHDWLAERQRQWPSALSATATHDTKRGEDVRARLNVLSEIPGAWKGAVATWRGMNRRFKSEVNGRLAPDSNEEYQIYQTLVGIWPFGDLDDEAYAQIRQRMSAYLVKALREAKVHTGWLSPNDAYEEAVIGFADAILDRRRGTPFLQSLLLFQARVADLGIYNSLSQLLVKITAPGVPDFYQGTELWDLNLVDPDNRRPVDYEKRRRLLETLQRTPVAGLPEELVACRADGRIKMFVAMRALAMRAQLRRVFEGDYLPLTTTGTKRDSLFAFARHRDDRYAITCVPRLVASLVPGGGTPLGRTTWSDTAIVLPSRGHAAVVQPVREVFTDRTIVPELTDSGVTIPAATLFETFPVALLTCSI
jgi:(1->4)-alpha-D-glucan 1-alpha-D-glucosylmutase